MASSTSKRSRNEFEKEEKTGTTSSCISLSLAMSMTTWQQSCNTVGQRDVYILDNNMFTDVKFVIGSEEEVFLCHRIFLAKTSPAFASMLFGELHKNETADIKIPDVAPKAFKAIINYIYSGEVKLDRQDEEDVWEVLYAAKKYLMPDSYLSFLRNFLRDEIYDGCSLWSTIKLAAAYDEPELLESAWQVVRSDTEDALEHENFTEISPQILETLVKEDNLACTEQQLFDACIKWSRHEAERLSIEPETQNLRSILSNIIPHIRFITYDNVAFNNGPAKIGILSDNEIGCINNMIQKGTNNLPENICNNDVVRQSKPIEKFYVFGEPKNIDNTIVPNFKYQRYASACYTSSLTDVLVGVKIPSQVKEKKEKDSYEENVTIYFTESRYSGPKLIHSINFNKIVKYNSNIEISFENSLTFRKKHREYSFDVVFHNSGWYPTGELEKLKCSSYENFAGYKNARAPEKSKYQFIKYFLDC